MKDLPLLLKTVIKPKRIGYVSSKSEQAEELVLVLNDMLKGKTLLLQLCHPTFFWKRDLQYVQQSEEITV